MTTTPTKTTATFSAIVAALCALLASYWILRWGFIKYWEWQHEGRSMVFVIGPEIDAAALATLSSIVAFILTLKRLLRRRRC